MKAAPPSSGMPSLYAKGIADLGPGDFVKVDCAVCRHIALLTPEAVEAAARLWSEIKPSWVAAAGRRYRAAHLAAVSGSVAAAPRKAAVL